MARETADAPVLTTTVSDSSEIDVAIVLAVSDVLGTSPDDLDEVLYDAINPDALCELMQSNDTVSVEFEFNDCLVTVDTDGHVAVAE